jgi:transglutaminase-like putative cysteine protease
LYDSQISLRQPGVAWHVRVVQRILTRAGAERAAHVALEFDPAHERLYVHCIRVWRGEQCIEHARPSDIQILRRETQLERLALNGRLTATLLIPDLRVDDHLEVACTVVSQNPVLGGRCAAWIIFNAYAPCIETRQRLIRPLNRPVFLKAFNDPPQRRLEARAEIEESTWSIRGQERETVEELFIPWSVKNPCYQITELERWGDVSKLFEKYYQDSDLPPELVTELDRLASKYLDESERAVEWLRTVQRQLRYFALALGEGGLVPRSLAEIWTKRFGDCKDAARLYVAGARYLGLDACAALISTTHGLSLADFLPSPQVFNHVAVRVRASGATYWLDPTMQVQGGSLADIPLFHAGWALPLTADTTDLERLPATPPLQHIRCEDTIRFGPRVDSVAEIDRRIDFRFWAADSVRNRIEGEGLTKVSAQLLQDLRTTWPDAVERSPLRVADDFGQNCLSLLCTYETGNCWKPGDKQGRLAFHIADPFLGKELAPLKSTRRKGAIFLGRPRKATWRASLQMPCDWRGTGWRRERDDSGIHFTSALTIERGEVVFERELAVNAWSATPDKAEAYQQIAEDARMTAATLWARQDMEGNLQPAAAAAGPSTPAPQRDSRSYRWAALLLLAPLLTMLKALISPQTDLSANSNSSFVTVPEAHVSSVDGIADSSLEKCVETGRDSVGPYLHSNCAVSARIRVARPYGGEPWEGTLDPGGKAYVYSLDLSGLDAVGTLAACPSPDQIVEIRTGLPWTTRGTRYRCQHSLR